MADDIKIDTLPSIGRLVTDTGPSCDPDDFMVGPGPTYSGDLQEGYTGEEGMPLLGMDPNGDYANVAVNPHGHIMVEITKSSEAVIARVIADSLAKLADLMRLPPEILPLVAYMVTHPAEPDALGALADYLEERQHPKAEKVRAMAQGGQP